MLPSTRVPETRDILAKWLGVALLLILCVCLAGSYFFFHVWASGDAKAQAFAGFLAFLAACISAIVTVVYVSLTYSALRKAQESINLQQQQVEQMRSALKLQREEWEQKVRVHPRFWIVSHGEAQWYVPDPQRPGGVHVQALQFSRNFAVRVWNYSEQSFIVESLSMQRSDVGMVANQQMRTLQVVVKPHSVADVDVSFQLMPMLTQTQLPQANSSLLMNNLDKISRIYVKLTFSDWSQNDADTEVREFEISYRPGDGDVAISPPRVPKPDGVRPSI